MADFVSIKRSFSYLLIKSRDSLFIYFADHGFYKIKCPNFDIIEQILTDETLIYSEKGKKIKIYNNFKNGLYITYTDTNGGFYIINQYGKISDLKEKGIKLSYKEGGIFIVPFKDKTVIYNNVGKYLFSIKTTEDVKLHRYGFIIANIRGSKFSAVFDLKGKNLGKINPNEAYDYSHQFKYFTDNDSCLAFSLNMSVKQLCRKDDVYKIKNDFLVLANSDTTFDIYNDDLQLIHHNLLAEEVILKNPYINYQNYTTYRYKDRTYLIDTKGLVVPLPDSLISVVPINKKYFVSFSGNRNNCKGVIFDSTGEILFTIPNFDKSIMPLQNFQYYTDANSIMLPIENKINDSNEFRIDMYIIQPDTCILRTFQGHYFCSSLLGQYVGQSHDINFCKITHSMPIGLNVRPIEYYIDKYGTIYYDE